MQVNGIIIKAKRAWVFLIKFGITILAVGANSTIDPQPGGAGVVNHNKGLFMLTNIDRTPDLSILIISNLFGD